MALLILGTCSCATEIHEEDFYTDEGNDGAVITHFFSPSHEHIGKNAWDSIREGMTCEAPDSIGRIKSEFEKLCSRVSCSEVDAPKLSQQELDEFRKTVSYLNSFFGRLSNARDASK